MLDYIPISSQEQPMRCKNKWFLRISVSEDIISTCSVLRDMPDREAEPSDFFSAKKQRPITSTVRQFNLHPSRTSYRRRRRVRSRSRRLGVRMRAGPPALGLGLLSGHSRTRLSRGTPYDLRRPRIVPRRRNTMDYPCLFQLAHDRIP
jgi:hypothetical protein